MDAHSSGAAGYSTASGRHPGTTLTDAAARLWPTPNVPNGGRAMSEADVEARGATDRGKRQVGLESATRLWPTPTVLDSGGTTRVNRSPSPGAATRPVLALAAECWPTPGAAAGDKGPVAFLGGNPSLWQAASTWGTPRVPTNEGRGSVVPDPRGRLEDQAASWARPMDGAKPSAGRRRTADLSHQATLWATPAAKDGSAPAGTRFGSPDLSRQAREHETSGPPSSPPDPTSRRHLNPRFVEWLMGWPEGWADAATPLDPTSFERWATASSRWLRRLRGSRWLSVPA
jgi:hypothetical protein